MADSTLFDRSRLRTRTPSGPPELASSARALAIESAPAPRCAPHPEAAAPWLQAPAPEPIESSHPPPSLFEELPDGVLRFDRRLVVVYANPALERATSISRGAFIGRPLNHVENFTHYAPLWEAKLVATFDSLEARSFKFSYAHPAGSKNFEVRLVLELDGQGEASFVTAIVRDVTVPRTALRATRAADAMLSTLMSSARIGMAVLDGNLRYVRCNAYLAQLLGVEAGQLLGRRLDQVFDHSSQPAVARSLERMRDGEVRVPQQIEYEFAGGDRPWVRERRTPLFGSHGGFSGVFLTVERLDRERFAETSLAALRQALDSAGEMVLEIGRDGAILDANETALAWLGYSREQLTGLRLGAIDASLTEERFAEMIEALLGRGAFHGEARYRTRLGSEFEVDLVLQRVEHSDREFIFLLVRDISDRKRIEVELAENAERLATIFNESPVGILQLDSSFRIRRANRAACALLGYREHDLLGRDPVRLMHPDDVVASLKQRERLMEYLPAGAALVSEPDRRLLDREGRTVWVKLGWRALGSGDDSRRYLLVMENFTDQKLFEGQLRSALREQQSLLETMSTGVVKTRDGQIVLANREFGRMFGYTDAEAIGMSLWQLCLHRDGQVPEDVPGLPAVRPGLTTSAEVVLYGRDERPRWCLVQARPLDDGETDAATAEAIFTFQDFTELRQQREAAARSAAELQSLLAESRLIFDTALVGLLFVREGRLVRANAAMEDLLGCETGTLVDQIQLFAHPSDRMLLASLEERFETIRSAGVCEFELLLYRRRSDPIWVAVQGRAVNPERPELGYIFAFVNIDERKRSERELRSALNELQLIFDNALVAILYVANDLVVKSNATAERMFGFSAPDLQELQFGTLFADPADWRGVQAGWVGAASGSATFEHPMRRADGSVFWCAGNVRPLDEEAPERGVIVTLMDSDARRRSEEDLRTMRNYLDLVIENLPVLVSVRDVKTGRFVSLNRAGEAMTGLARSQVIGRTWHEVYGRQFADLYREMDRKAIADGQQIDRPRDVMLRADGRTLIVNQRVVPLFDGAPAGQGPASYVMSIVDDLTDEVRAEAALRETETRFRQFAENIDQLVFIANGDLTEVLYVNSRYTQLVGAPPSELMDNPRNALLHVHFDDAARLAHQLPRVIAGLRRLRRGELSVRVDHPSGGVRTISVRLNPARMHDGQLRVFGVAEDVTARMAAEQQRLEDAVRQRDILVREVHHRIKNNLQGVAGLLQHMASGKPEVAPQLNEIAGQIQAIAQVHGLQIGAGGTLPVLGVVQGIFNNLATMFGVEVRLAPSASVLWRWGLPEGEAVPLALVINELGTNAIKYRESRDLTLEVRVEPRPDGLVVRIQNAGRLPAGFDLGRISSGVSGLGLIKALLPRRGAQLTLEQEDDRVTATLDLSAPAVREEMA